uniref:C3HC4 type zinc finger protein n=1 Tax=Pithovirus LCPAC201 TaxID=2506591 RepID=A0A481Z4W2_9VIRU|nr:MAG: C3HC4 type zinc finger protein [Pithovirus LCPAC201]
MTLHEENEIRDYYLSLLGDNELSFQGLINKISQELATDYGSLMNYSPTIAKKTFYYPNQNQKIDTIKNKVVFSIGRMAGNDIVQDDLNVSRINCLIFIYQNKLAILDSWSLNGTICTNMKTGEEFKTYPGSRQIITFHRNDMIMIRTHSGSIIINPEKCLACKINPKQVILSCGHLQICYSCYQQIKNDSASEELCSRCILPIRDLLFGNDTKIFLPPNQLDPMDQMFSFNPLNYPHPPEPLKFSSGSSPSFEDSSSINPWQVPISSSYSSSYSSSSDGEIRINQLSVAIRPSPILIRGSEGSNKRKRSQKKTNLPLPTKKIKLSEPPNIIISKVPQENTYQKRKIIRRSLSENSCLTGIFVKGVLHCRVSPWGNLSNDSYSSISRSFSSPSRINEQKI